MRKNRWLILVAMMLTALMFLQGCEVKQENPNLKTYQEYVQSLLNVNYLGDATLYEQISGSNNGEEVYNECISNIADVMVSRFAINKDMMTNETADRLYNVAKELCGKASYAVDEAELNEEIYTVKVNVKPFNYFETAQEAFDNYIDDFNNRAAQGEFLDMSEGEYETTYAEGVVDILQKALGDSQYLNTSSYIVTIKINENGESYVSDDELAKIGEMMFPKYQK